MSKIKQFLEETIDKEENKKTAHCIGKKTQKEKTKTASQERI